MGGGVGSPLVLSLLLGGVLKGETSTASEEVSGTRFARAGESTDIGFGAILGFPARLMGGGTGGTEGAGRSCLRGSVEGALPVLGLN
jgi:hypothetical protein